MTLSHRLREYTILSGETRFLLIGLLLSLVLHFFLLNSTLPVRSGLSASLHKQSDPGSKIRYTFPETDTWKEIVETRENNTETRFRTEYVSERESAAAGDEIVSGEEKRAKMDGPVFQDVEKNIANLPPPMIRLEMDGKELQPRENPADRAFPIEDIPLEDDPAAVEFKLPEPVFEERFEAGERTRDRPRVRAAVRPPKFKLSNPDGTVEKKDRPSFAAHEHRYVEYYRKLIRKFRAVTYISGLWSKLSLFKNTQGKIVFELEISAPDGKIRILRVRKNGNPAALVTELTNIIMKCSPVGEFPEHIKEDKLYFRIQEVLE